MKTSVVVQLRRQKEQNVSFLHAVIFECLIKINRNDKDFTRQKMLRILP